MSENFRDLKVWKKSIDVVMKVYGICSRLPKEEKYALGDQMRRAAVSISSNISEGDGRNSIKDYTHFLDIARGSTYELTTQIIICEKLNYISADEAQEIEGLCDEISKMLNAMIKSLRVRSPEAF